LGDGGSKISFTNQSKFAAEQGGKEEARKHTGTYVDEADDATNAALRMKSL